MTLRKWGVAGRVTADESFFPAGPPLSGATVCLRVPVRLNEDDDGDADADTAAEDDENGDAAIANDDEEAPMEAPKVGRCRLTVSEPVLKAPMVSALEAKI
jgi:hypothetical protein